MIQEKNIRSFFEGRIGIDILIAELDSAVHRTEGGSSYYVEDEDIEFEIEAKHLIKLCNSVLSGELASKYLKDFAFLLIASDTLSWDSGSENGGRVAEVLEQWSSPETNYSLNIENIKKWKQYLITGHEEVLSSLI